jgi:hypothetical protein
MKQLPYNMPEFTVFSVNVESGFAQTSNVEDPVIKPDQEW